MNNENYIKLNRSLLEWEWWSDFNTSRLFIYMLLKANWKEGRFKGQVIKRGSFVSTLDNIVVGTGLSKNKVRTALAHLEQTGEITHESHALYTVFTVNKYDLYQGNHTEITQKSHTNHTQTTQIEERKEKKEGKNNIILSDESICPPANAGDMKKVTSAWNELGAFGIPAISRLTPGTKRFKCLHARLSEYGLDAVVGCIERIKKSDFLLGRATDFCVTFDWFVKPNNFPKIYEGQYDNRKPGTGVEGDGENTGGEAERDRLMAKFREIAEQ